MAKVTWLGEDVLHNVVTHDGHTIEGAGPSFTIWGGVKFPKGEAVEVTDAHMLKKAKINQFFSVEEDEPKRGPGRPKVKTDGDQDH